MSSPTPSERRINGATLKTLVVSSVHITAADRMTMQGLREHGIRFLGEHQHDDTPEWPCEGVNVDGGIFYCISAEQQAGQPTSGFPWSSHLLAVLNWADSRGFRYVVFDRINGEFFPEISRHDRE